MENRGSVWRRWDLHIHTKGTHKNDNFKSSIFENYCEVLFKKAIEQNISVIGVTDYCTIDNYKKTLEYVKNIDNNSNFDCCEKTIIKQILLLPNIELRITPVTNSETPVNIHAIFNPSYVDRLDNDFFGSIKMMRGEETYKMNRDGLKQLGEISKNTGSTQCEEISIRKGVEKFVIEHSNITELLKNNSNLRNNTLIVLSNSNSDGASGIVERDSQLSEVRRNIYCLSDIIFSSNENDRDFFLGKKINKNGKTITPKEVIEKCGSLKPCVHGSDAHTEEKIFNPDDDRFCWIKAEPTFEGLKQIIYEPELRCKIQKDNPDNKKLRNCIKSVAFKGKDFIENEIFFNNDLNAIIGGKSSGKSLLLYYIANTIDYKYAFKQQNPNYESTEYMILKDKYGFSEQDDFDFKINWSDGITHKFSERETVKDRKFVYIPQSYILNLTENIEAKSRETLGKFIREILLQKEENSKLYKDFLKDVKELDDSRETYIDLYFKEKDKIENLLNEKKEIGDKEGIKKHLNNLNEMLDKLKQDTGITKNELSRYDCLSKRNKRIDNYNTYLETELNNLIDVVKNHSNSISIHHGIKEENYNYKSVKQFVKQFETIVSNAKRELCELNHSIGEKKDIQSKRAEDLLKIIEDELSPISEKLKNSSKIKDIEETTKNEEVKLSKIEKIHLNIKIHEEEKEILKKEIINSYEESFNKYKKVIDDLNKIGKSFKDIGLTGSIKFHYKKYRESLLPFLNANSKEINDLKKTNLFKDHGDSLPDIDYEKHIEEMEATFDKIVSDGFKFNKYKSPKDCVKVLFKNEFFDYWELKEGNDEMANMSPGKANLIILKLLVELSDSEAPILIDQPEDNLDNRSIYSELVKFLRKRKLDRQIIVVSHNPNVVVSSDSDNVIVANQNDKDQNNKKVRFEYINGALENSFKVNEEDKSILQSMGIKEHVTEILEGGKEAFLKREEKYGLKMK